MYWAHLNENKFLVKKEEADARPLQITSEVIEISERDYNSISIGWKSVEEGWISPIDLSSPSDGFDFDIEEVIKGRITEIQVELSSTNYVILGYIESQFNMEELPDDVKEVCLQRKHLRNELSQLREELQKP